MLGELNAELNENFPLEFFDTVFYVEPLIRSFLFISSLFCLLKAFPFSAALVSCLSANQSYKFQDFQNMFVISEWLLRGRQPEFSLKLSEK